MDPTTPLDRKTIKSDKGMAPTITPGRKKKKQALRVGAIPHPGKKKKKKNKEGHHPLPGPEGHHPLPGTIRKWTHP
ncbi:hypothetical protein CHS0354_001261, partial [Potamilus streckersoni]